MIKIFLLVLSSLWTNVALSERNQFSDFFNSVESLSANFSQTIYDEGLALLSSTTGNFSFQRPQQLRWNTTTPNEQILLLNNDELWQIDVELEQAILQQTKDFSKTPLYWLINKPDSIKNTPKFSHQEGGINWYLAVNTHSQPIEFGFINGLLHAISLENELGQIVTISFNQLRINPNISAQTFELAIAPNFDIIK
ncbi:MAG: outer-membrane lipoprotein carrier protein LolA [Gammaproteobacteria bacterium]|nr:outer-membrane lipoprotein carrier protein LolA [Gammaproteobacteria bacterium]